MRWPERETDHPSGRVRSKRTPCWECSHVPQGGPRDRSADVYAQGGPRAGSTAVYLKKDHVGKVQMSNNTDSPKPPSRAKAWQVGATLIRKRESWRELGAAGNRRSCSSGQKGTPSAGFVKEAESAPRPRTPLSALPAYEEFVRQP
ncbi:hypothetical protein MRX96_042161 [Rhipicephalus microplus]